MSLIVRNLDKDGNDLPARVYRDDKGKYTIGVSRKVNNEYDTRYYPVEFLKGTELENKTDIIIKHALITWYDWEFEGKKGTKYPIKIIAFDKVENKQDKPDEITPQNINDKWESAKNITIDDEDQLPFF